MNGGPTRVLVLCDTVGLDGGTESYLSRVIPGLRDRGVDVRVAARRVTDPHAFGVPATELGWAADNAPSNPAAAEAIRSLIGRLRPDVAIVSNVHDPAAMTAARSARRLVVRIHDHRLFCPQGDRQYPHFPATCTLPMSIATCLTHAFTRGCVAGVGKRTIDLVHSRSALRAAALRADDFIVSSAFMAQMCGRNGAPEERIHVFPPPFGDAIARAPRPARDRVLFAGRLVRDKGLASLIRAIALIPRERRPELAVAGAMTKEARTLPKSAARLGVAMTMLGMRTPAELVAEIDASTLVAVPSLWPEPFGLMGIEAQARGRPLVAYDVGSISEWMGSAGILVRRGDESAFATSIEIVRAPERWPAFSDAGLRQAERYRTDRHVDSIMTLIGRSSAPLAKALHA